MSLVTDIVRLALPLTSRSADDLKLMGSASGVFGHYPRDLMLYILELHAGHRLGAPANTPGSYKCPLELVISRDYPAQSLLYRFSLVNKHWYDVIIPLLYSRPVLASAPSACQFANSVKMANNLSSYVQCITILDLSDDITGGSFFNAVYCGTARVRRQTEDAIRTIMSIREPGLLDVVFVTKQPDDVVDTSERDGSLLERKGKISAPLDAMNLWKKRKTLSHIRSLTLHGFASHLLYTPSSRWLNTRRMAFAHLHYLSLQNVFLNQVRWPDTPALTTLSIAQCSIAGQPSIPSPTTAPRLRALTWVKNRGWPYPEVGLNSSAFLLPHSAKLSSLEVDFGVYDDLNRSHNFHDSFPALRELALRKPSRIYRFSYTVTPWTTGVVPGRLLRGLGMLCITGSRCTLEVLVAFNAEHGGRILSRSPSICSKCTRKRYTLRVTGHEAFWNTVPSWHQHEAKATGRKAHVTCVHEFLDGNIGKWWSLLHRRLPAHSSFLAFKPRENLEPLYKALGNNNILFGMLVWESDPYWHRA
jgi:hypothetical protein